MSWFYLAFISAIFSAVAAILQKKILQTQRPWDFLFWPALLDLLFVIPIIFFIPVGEFSFVKHFVIVVKSLFNAFGMILILFGLKSLPISVALPWMILTPALVAACSFFIFHETITFIQVLGMILIAVGTMGLQIKDLKTVKFKTLLKGHRYIFMALGIMTISTLLDRLVLNNFKTPAFEFLFWQHVYQFAFFLPLYFFISGINRKEIIKTWKNVGVLMIVLSCSILIYRYFNIEAIKAGGPLALVLSVKRTSVFMAITFGGMFFKEDDLFKKMVMTILMLFGAFLIQLR